MTQIVVMPGGFHPFHAGHMALYNSAREAFPGAEVYVAATNDTSSRPFPFAVKEKLAKLAGVEPGHFVQVKSPFRAEEITAKFDPSQDTLIFVRSQKDAGSPPRPGGTKKDGSPAYLQPLAGAESMEPFAQHAYMAYLPTVEFGPGMTSATQIRTAWPGLNDKRKTALVMSLYPKTQTNPELAAVVVKLLDAAIGGELQESTGDHPLDPAPGREFVFNKYFVKITPTAIEIYHGGDLVLRKPGDFSNPTRQDMYNARRYTSDLFKKQLKKKELARLAGKAVDENQSTTELDELRILHPVDKPGNIDVYYRPLGTPGDKRKVVAKNIPYRGLDLLTRALVKKFNINPEDLEVIPVEVAENQGWAATYETNTQNFVGGMKAGYQARENQPVDEDYIEEKWSQKYKSSINCANPKGFSQRAHCAGRKK